ncbi:hypothetical protein [Hyphomonas atlantica]|uniref:hypothetical protein n=1 Tax=Hyphomonas atlantica TaxID=1280948 RepID=UPI00138E32D2|nr:hypothetical protein [Hyphomonas atlantica]
MCDIATQMKNSELPLLKGILLLRDLSWKALKDDDDLHLRISGIDSQIDHLAYFIENPENAPAERVDEISKRTEFFKENILIICDEILARGI